MVKWSLVKSRQSEPLIKIRLSCSKLLSAVLSCSRLLSSALSCCLLPSVALSILSCFHFQLLLVALSCFQLHDWWYSFESSRGNFRWQEYHIVHQASLFINIIYFEHLAIRILYILCSASGIKNMFVSCLSGSLVGSHGCQCYVISRCLTLTLMWNILCMVMWYQDPSLQITVTDRGLITLFNTLWKKHCIN